MLVSFAGRFHSARGSLDDVAAEAARAASVRQDADDAAAAARRSAAVSLDEICEDWEIETDTRNFKPDDRTEVGRVEVSIDCRVSLVGLSLLAIPGEISLQSRATEVIDRYRAEERL